MFETHADERTYPVYEGKSDRSNVDPKATIYIVTGAAGSPEMHEAFTNTPPSWSAFRSNTFGYSRMCVEVSAFAVLRTESTALERDIFVWLFFSDEPRFYFQVGAQ